MRHLLLALPLVGCAAAQAETTVKSAANTASVYVYEAPAQGFNTKTYFYDNGHEVVAFDTQFTPDLARAALTFLRTKTQNPLTYAVITHPNPDKFNGLSVFQSAGATVVASAATAAAMPEVDAYKRAYFINAQMFTPATYPKLGAVDKTFSGAVDLTLGNGDIVHLAELAEPGVSSTQTVAYLPAANALVVGDLVHFQAHAWLEGGIVGGQPRPTLRGWIADLSELQRAYASRRPVVLGGRGESGLLDIVVPAQISYLTAADQLVSAYVAALTPAQRTALQGPDAQPQYNAIQAQFVARFPDYQLGYMIGYGVYGLVNQKLAAVPAKTSMLK